MDLSDGALFQAPLDPVHTLTPHSTAPPANNHPTSKYVQFRVSCFAEGHEDRETEFEPPNFVPPERTEPHHQSDTGDPMKNDRLTFLTFDNNLSRSLNHAEGGNSYAGVIG